MDLRKLKIADYNYSLPRERIALYPLAERDASKLLVYRPRAAEGEKITESVFRKIGEFLPQNAFLVFNDTRVVRARLVFHKGLGGARIEIFCLEPSLPADIAMAFSAKGKCCFKCLIGNNKKWKEGALSMDFAGGVLQARRLEAVGEAFLVEFSWEPSDLSFAEVLEEAGKVPLPPYIRREAEDSDTLRYQTVFAKYNGSVAAPTAGLHFTPGVLEDLAGRGISRDFITLHVGAGTFKPVKSEEIGDHSMHREHIVVTRETVSNLLAALQAGKPVIAVGTTSMRSLESLYWLGVRLLSEPGLREEALEVAQWDPYEDYAGASSAIGPSAALQALLTYMNHHNLGQIHACTALMIAPGYKFAFCKGLITNFHQPQSTLLLLVAALIGDKWRRLYDYAMENGFRFLSYGDSCLFLP